MIDPVLGLGLVVLVLAMIRSKGVGGAPPDTAVDAGHPGHGPGGSPKAAPGHRTWGSPPATAAYTIPAGWDPVRGIWISPDCVLVVEGPAFWTGLSGPPGSGRVDPNVTVALSAQTIGEVLRDPTNGAMGFVDYWAEQGLGSPEIVTKMMVELAPMCGQVPRAMWGRGLAAWYDASVERVQQYLESTL